VDEGIIDRSPCAAVRRPKAEPVHQTLGLDRGELAALLAVAQAKSARDFALVSLLAMNGLRISEALGASVSDLGSERGHRVLSVVRKGGRTALVPLAPRTAAAIDACLAERVSSTTQPTPQNGDGLNSVPLFGTASGRPLDPDAAAKTVRRLAKRAGIEKRVSPHTLRHSFRTAALDAGASLRDVQDAMGHADPRTTRGYDRGRHNLDRHPTHAVAAALG
jgi:integrase/recombinase XerD